MYLIVRKKCEVTYFMSQQAQADRTRKLLIAGGVFCMGIFGFIASFVIADAIDRTQWEGLIPVPFIVSVVLFILGIVLLMVFQNTIRIRKHKDGRFWLKGFCNEYLEMLRDVSHPDAAGYTQ
ncbi:MAG: hypothetical protein GC164_00880 [Phycisphaera sp.]|nr:hypothetical protein [Phycisphaera sp.]